MSRPAWIVAVVVACALAVPSLDEARDETVPANVASAVERQQRRAYDGAPPVIPHEPFHIDCEGCHAEQPVEVPDVGWAPALPHRDTAGIGGTARCEQCHVFKFTDEVWKASAFEPFRRAGVHGPRAHPLAPPRMPHGVFMHENCLACHSGPGARAEVRTSHPERVRCRQCHVPAGTDPGL